MILKSLALIVIIFLFFLAVIVISVLRLIGSFLFGKRTAKTFYNESQNQQTEPHDNEYRSSNNNQSGEKKKVFDDDEGEYVDFEEIKDDSSQQ